MKYEMKTSSQEDLIASLKSMNLEELRYAQGCGIPGHANTIALDLLRIRKSEYKKFMESQSKRSVPETESEKRLSLTTQVSTDDKNAWKQPGEKDEEDDESGESAIHAFESGRKGDS
ncbi:MAG: hypothetical protein U9P49_04280 [Thermodesulfobacteriota bacterium]|nr:hypothetical protein [Thermodesulfobacteriota bacterium]